MSKVISWLATILVFSVPFVAWCVAEGVSSIRFNIEVGGYLKRASDANTIEIASKELDKAIAGITKRGLKSGHTGVYWDTPATDLDFWYNNITTADAELKALPETATMMERSNMLIKLRETLIDHGHEGDAVTVPYGAAIYPNNVMYNWWGIGSILWGCIGVVVLTAMSIDSSSSSRRYR